MGGRRPPDVAGCAAWHADAARPTLTAAGLLTVGHGTASQAKLTELLHGAGVALLVDVRTVPGSRRHPQVARAALEQWLPEAGIAYRWEPDLGGFRSPPPDSPDVAWREPMFRGYAAWMRTPTFTATLDQVLAEVVPATAVMCSEAVWWRCHRRLIADFAVLARGVPVWHLMHDGRLVPHQPTAGVRYQDDGLLRYDAGTLPTERGPRDER